MQYFIQQTYSILMETGFIIGVTFAGSIIFLLGLDYVDREELKEYEQ